MLGGQPVVDGQDAALRKVRQPPADAVMAVEVADHPAAAMQVKQARPAAVHAEAAV